VELQAGNHKLTVKADGYEPVERSLVMSVQHSTEITINLRPKVTEPATPALEAKKEPPPDAPKQVDLVPPPPPPTVVEEQPKKGGRTFTYVAGGVAVAGLGAGVTFGVLSNSNLSTLKSTQHSRADADGLISGARTDATVANVSYGVAAAAAATAVVLFFLEGN
jgi:hypothetical protein